jgi:histone H2B
VCSKQVHPDTGISKEGNVIMNSFINDIFERVSPPRPTRHPQQEGDFVSREIRPLFDAPGELAKHAVSEEPRAVTKFSSS